MNEWKSFCLGDVCNICSSKRIFAREYTKQGIPFYRGKEIIEKHNKNKVSNTLYISEKRYLEVKSKYDVPKIGDILLTSVGTLGIAWFIDESNFYFKDGNLTWLRASDLIDSKFLYWWLNSKEAQEQIERKCIGTTQKALTIETLNKFTIFLPPLDTQKKIAAVLSALDDKIELNNAINKNLEEQAQAIFKSWFIDFEPFGGTMPDDWKEIYLSDIATFIGGYSYKGKELKNSSTAMITIKNFNRNGGFKMDGLKEIIPSAKVKAEHYVEIFDVFVAHTDLTQNAEIIGRAENILSLYGYEKMIFSMDVVKVIPKTNEVSRFLLSEILRTKKFKVHCMEYVNGTTVLHLSKKALPEYKLFFPTDFSQLTTINKIFSAIYERLSNNESENQKLGELRDVLLPRLMSGEIDVSEVEI